MVSTGDGSVGVMFKNINQHLYLLTEVLRAWGEGDKFRKEPERAVDLTLGQMENSKGRE